VLVLGVVLAGAVALSALLIIVGTLLTASIASEADIERLGSVTVVASIPDFRFRGKGERADLSEVLATLTFGGAPQPVLVAEPATASEVAS
jgi:hypothetical protein